MANVSYTPTFHHFPWRNRLDRVEAAGPNGFNVRFAAIESDLHQVSTVVDQIGAEIDRIISSATPPPRERRVVFTPTFQDVREGPPFHAGWDVNTAGFPLSGGIPGHQLDVKGIINLDLPHGATFVSFGIAYEIGGDPTVGLSISLSRTPLRPTPPPATTEELAGIVTTFHSSAGPAQLTLPARSPALAKIDLDAFRYFLIISAGAPAAVTSSITIRTFELRYIA